LAFAALKNWKKTISRAVIAHVSIFTALVALSVLALQPVHDALQQRLSFIRDNLIRRAETFIGREIRYSSIRPMIFDSVEIRNVAISSGFSNDGRPDLLFIPRLRLSFSFWNLIKGKKASVRRVFIDHPAFSMDLEKDRDIIDLFASSSEASQYESAEIARILSEFFPEQPDFRIRNGSCRFTDGEKSYQVQDLTVDIQGNDNNISLDGKFKAGFSELGFFNRSFDIRTEMNINGAFSADLREGRAEIALASLSGKEGPRDAKPLFDVRPVNIGLVYKDSVIKLGVHGESYDCLFDYGMETGAVAAEINCRNFPLSDMVVLSEEWEGGNQMLARTVTGNVSFERERNGAARYSVALYGGDKTGSGDSFALRAHGSEKNIVVDEFHFNASAAGSGPLHGKITVSGKTELPPLSPEGTVVFENFSLTGEENANAVFLVFSRDKEIIITADTAVFGRTALNAVDLRLLLMERNMEISLSASSADAARVRMNAVLNYKPRQLEASIEIDSFPSLGIMEMARPYIRNIAIPAPARGYLQNAAINAEIFFMTDFHHFMYNAPEVFFVSNEGIKEINIGYFSFSGTDQRLELSEGRISLPEKDFLFSGDVNYSNPMNIVFSINANYLDMSWSLEGKVLDKSQVNIRDSSGLHVNGGISKTGAVSGYVECLDFPVPVNDKPAYLTFYVSFRYNSKDLWSLEAPLLEIRDFARKSQGAPSICFLRTAGAANQDGAVLKELVYRDDISGLKGEADFSWSRNFSNLRLHVDMSEDRPPSSREESGELYLADGSLEDNHLELKVLTRNMRLDRFMETSGSVMVNGDVSISWESLQSFSAQLSLSSLYAKVRDNVIYASAEASLSSDELLIRDINLKYNEISAVMPSLRLSLNESLACANADINGSVFGKRLEGFIELEANFKHIDSWLEIKKTFDSVDGSVRLENVRYAELRPSETYIFMFSRSGGALSVSGGPKNMLRLEMDRDGNFFAGLSSPFPIRSSVAGSLKNGWIDAHCADFFMDMPVFWHLLPNAPRFDIAGGYITAQIDIRGRIWDPEFFGSGRGTSFRFCLPDYVPQDVRSASFNITAEGNEMYFDPVTVIAGNGMGTVSGWFQFDRWIPKNIGLEITIPRESPIPYNINFTGFLADGDASGRLFLTLDDSVFYVTGDLFANNAEMGLDTDEITRRQDRESFNVVAVTVNLTITTGPAVEFFWPNANIPILRANPELGTVVRISADTQDRHFSLNSDIGIRSGEVFYFERSFFIRQGNLVFKENEHQFSPRLSARAEIRDRTDNGPVTISMIIDNEPLLSFIPRFEANPSLTQLEIYSLLGQNLNNEENDANTIQRFFLTSTADLLAQFVFVRQFERQIRNFFHLDMFSARTQILQNAVLNITGLSQTPVDRSSRVGNYFDNTTIFGGKYIGQDMFIQGMLSMRYDENQTSLGGIKLEPDIGVELQSPFFSIRWDFIPYHPENWWINDNSITLTWSKSF
jgi:hypothetical protein